MVLTPSATLISKKGNSFQSDTTRILEPSDLKIKKGCRQLTVTTSLFY
ncbi:hypothetical protein NC99_04320 [Sunxiuqinia dokdonensis]|uniref:Uncharacterized protein n=1 Tax=Sunxiuqinia dokdonensis TaxID=1409788 RepID=A0A0L8VE43_9BACT|nr:hypothetical protein NC99_04320 [Sunxiuqinia dokdonensis]